MNDAQFNRIARGLPPVRSPESTRRFKDIAEGRVQLDDFTPRRRRRAATSGKTRVLKESCSCDGPAGVDASGLVLQGVRILGSNSLNRRRYTREAMNGALPMYDGAKVFLDHPDKPNGSRSVKDLIGILSDPAPDDSGLSGTLTLNPAHPYASAVAWLAKNKPQAIGLSHNAVGQGETDGNGVFVVNKIVSVHSVDLVVDPATVKGLFG